jgi:hypothetical protein
MMQNVKNAYITVAVTTDFLYQALQIVHLFNIHNVFYMTPRENIESALFGGHGICSPHLMH